MHRDSAQRSKAFKKGGDGMDAWKEVLVMLGRIEGELVEIRKLSERVRRLEVWQSWLKGAWAVIVAAYLYLVRQASGR
jgi:hypothetical protein